MKTYKLSLEKFFYFVYLCISILQMIAMPPFMAPDEYNHYFRAEEISEGIFMSPHDENGYVNANVSFDGNVWNSSFNTLRNTLKGVQFSYDSPKINIRDTEHLYNNTALYSPVNYAVPAVGLFIGRFFTGRVLFSIYLAKLLNVICAGFLCYCAVKAAPYGKWAFILMFLLPVNMNIAASLSPDAMTLAVSGFVAAFCMKLRERENVLVFYEYIILYFFAYLISCFKIVYLPLCLLYFTIPAKLFKSRKIYLANIIAIGAIVFINSLFWLKKANVYLVEFNPGVNAAAQLEYIIHNIPGYLLAVFRTIIFMLPSWAAQLFGNVVGQKAIHMFPAFVFLGMVLYAVIFAKHCIGHIKLASKSIVLISALTFLITAGLVFTSLYIQWTPVANNVVNGVQARYFVPIFFAVLSAFCYDKTELCKNEIVCVCLMDIMQIMYILYIFF